jgi:hypothetical protein
MLRSQNCRSVGFPYQENCTDTVHCTYLHDVASDEEYHRVFDVVFRWKVQVRRNGRQVVTELQRKSDCDVAGVFILCCCCASSSFGRRTYDHILRLRIHDIGVVKCGPTDARCVL